MNMHKKILTLLIVLIFSVSCLAVVAEDNNTTDNMTAEKNVDLMDYIIPISVSDNGISFSDGFTGFCLDLSKDSITLDDKFSSSPTKDEDVENKLKLAIIGCYKDGDEDHLGGIISQVLKALV